MSKVGRPKGIPKAPTSGRKKGVLNKKRYQMQEFAEKLEINPLEVLLLFAKGDEEALGYKEPRFDQDGNKIPYITPDMRLNAAKEATQYLIPKLKSIEVSGAEDKPPLFLEMGLDPDTIVALTKKARGKG